MDCFASLAMTVGSRFSPGRGFPERGLVGISVAGRGTTDMLQAEGAEPIKVEFDNFEHGFPAGFGPGGWDGLAYVIGIAFAVFQLYVAAFNYLPSQVVRGIHVGFLLLMTFGLIGNFTAKSDLGRAAGWLIGAAGFLCGLYQWIFYPPLLAPATPPPRPDLLLTPSPAAFTFQRSR